MNFNWMPFKLVNKREWERIKKASTVYKEKYMQLQVDNEILEERISSLEKKNSYNEDRMLGMEDRYKTLMEGKNSTDKMLQQSLLKIDELEEEIRKYMDSSSSYQKSIQNCTTECKKVYEEYEKLKKDYMKVLASNGGLKLANEKYKQRIKELEDVKAKNDENIEQSVLGES